MSVSREFINYDKFRKIRRSALSDNKHFCQINSDRNTSACCCLVYGGLVDAEDSVHVHLSARSARRAAAVWE